MATIANLAVMLSCNSAALTDGLGEASRAVGSARDVAEAASASFVKAAQSLDFFQEQAAKLKLREQFGFSEGAFADWAKAAEQAESRRAKAAERGEAQVTAARHAHALKRMAIEQAAAEFTKQAQDKAAAARAKIGDAFRVNADAGIAELMGANAKGVDKVGVAFEKAGPKAANFEKSMRNVLQIAKGGGILAGVSYAINNIGSAASQLTDIQLQLARGQITAEEATRRQQDAIIGSIPVIGNWANSIQRVKELFDGTTASMVKFEIQTKAAEESLNDFGDIRASVSGVTDEINGLWKSLGRAIDVDAQPDEFLRKMMAAASEEADALERIAKLREKLKDLPSSSNDIAVNSALGKLKDLETLVTGKRLSDEFHARQAKDAADAAKGVTAQAEAAKRARAALDNFFGDIDAGWDDMVKAANRIAEMVKTPAEKAAEQIAEAERLFSAGLLNSTQFERLKAMSSGATTTTAAPTGLAAAREFRFIGGVPNTNRAETLAQKQLEEAKKLNDRVQKTNEQLRNNARADEAVVFEIPAA